MKGGKKGEKEGARERVCVKGMGHAEPERSKMGGLVRGEWGVTHTKLDSKKKRSMWRGGGVGAELEKPARQRDKKKSSLRGKMGLSKKSERRNSRGGRQTMLFVCSGGQKEGGGGGVVRTTGTPLS